MARKKPDHIPAVKAVMTPFPWYIHIDDALTHAAEVMTEHEIRHLPVTDAEELVGVVTERDIGLLQTSTPPERRPGLKVRDACVLDAYVVGLDEPLDRVLSEMAERHIGSALVTREKKLAGIFTVTDACRHFAEFLRAFFPAPRDDEAA